jgi:hypothetical protein
MSLSDTTPPAPNMAGAARSAVRGEPGARIPRHTTPHLTRTELRGPADPFGAEFGEVVAERGERVVLRGAHPQTDCTPQ